MLDDSQYNGNITLLVNSDSVTLSLRDEVSGVQVLEVELTPEDFCALLGRHAYLECSIKYGHLDRIGKKLEIDHIKFPMPECDYKDRGNVAYQEALKVCPKGWVIDNYFGSKDSFGWDKDGKKFGRATIRRWVNPMESVQ